ncbi:MAG: HAD-IIA family hydrolase [bacterium]
MVFNGIKLIILDLDGVVIRGKSLVSGAKEAIDLLIKSGYKVVYLTNNSTRPRDRVVELLRGYGIDIPQSDIFTSGYLTALYISEETQKNARIFIIGEEGIVWELYRMGFKNIFWSSYEPPIDYVIVGMDRNFTFQKLTNAQQAIIHGAKFIATNIDPTFPIEDGIIPGGGSIVKAVEVASGVKSTVIGKPEILGLKLILEELGRVDSRDVILIGDRIETDIVAGKRLGCKTGLVLSGITSREDLKSLPEGLRPDLWGENLLDLVKGGKNEDHI